MPDFTPRGGRSEEYAMYRVTDDVIEAARSWPIWWRLGLQDIRSGFRRSTLGVGWIFVNFAVTILAVGVVYGALLGQQVKDFLPFLAAGLVVWLYLTSSIVEGSSAFVASEGYIKQIGITPYVYVLRFFVSISFKMLTSLSAFVVVALLLGVEFRWGVIWAAPGVLLLCAVSLLLIAIFAHLNARFRDAAHIASLGLQILFYVTPVLWPPEMLRARALGWIVDLNPLYHLLEVVRQPLLHSRPASLVNYQAVGLSLIGLTLIASALTWRFHRRLAYLL
jgi:ABC-type polysaccharide/polyol phosphate export permease